MANGVHTGQRADVRDRPARSWLSASRATDQDRMEQPPPFRVPIPGAWPRWKCIPMKRAMRPYMIEIRSPRSMLLLIFTVSAQAWLSNLTHAEDPLKLARHGLSDNHHPTEKSLLCPRNDITVLYLLQMSKQRPSALRYSASHGTRARRCREGGELLRMSYYRIKYSCIRSQVVVIVVYCN